MKFKKKILGSMVANKHIAEITGKRTHSRPFVWERVVSGKKEEYSNISGAMVLPTLTQPGFLILIGVEPDTNNLHAIKEFESDDPHEIISEAKKVQQEYGSDVIGTWWGDPEALMSIVNERNSTEPKIYISCPVDFEKADSFPLYLSRITVALSATHKVFFLNDCHKIRSHIQAFVQDKQARKDNNQAIAITGALIHSMLIIRPWEQSVESIELIPTRHEDYAAYQQEQTMKELEAQLF